VRTARTHCSASSSRYIGSRAGALLAGPGAGEEEEVVDEPRERLRLGARGLERLAVLGLGARRLGERQFGLAADDGHRRAQLVRRVGHELPLLVHRGLDAREQSVEGAGQPGQLADLAARREPLVERARLDAGGAAAHGVDGGEPAPRHRPPARAGDAEQEQHARDERLARLAQHRLLRAERLAGRGDEHARPAGPATGRAAATTRSADGPSPRVAATVPSRTARAAAPDAAAAPHGPPNGYAWAAAPGAPAARASGPEAATRRGAAGRASVVASNTATPMSRKRNRAATAAGPGAPGSPSASASAVAVCAR
jgi:hypothetical protein